MIHKQSTVIASSEGAKQSQKGIASSACGLLAMTTKIDRIDAELILAHLLGVSRAGLYIYDSEIGEKTIKEFDTLVSERATGKPVQYIIGRAGFMGLEFIVTPDVLIPRPETELLIETAIDSLRPMAYDLTAGQKLKILDIGAGSGNIAIALTKFVSDCKIISSDISSKALFIAKKNAQLNLTDGKIEFILSDLFNDLPRVRFDIIISNPPYVASGHICRLQKEIGFEPRIALDGGTDGFVIYRRLIKEAGQFLVKNGLLLLELGFGQAEEVEKLLISSNFKVTGTVIDYNNIKRIITARWIG